METITLPTWTIYLGMGVALFYTMVLIAIVLGRAGRHPMWGLLMLVPYVQIVAIWVFAFTEWKKKKRQ